MDPADCPTHPLWLERCLIALAFFLTGNLETSLIGRFLQFIRRQEFFDDRVILLYSVLYSFWTRFITASAIYLLSLVSLILFLIGEISVDAFGVILIGLIPSFQALDKLDFLDLSEYRYIAARQALCLPIRRFRYLRHGEPPNADIQGKLNIHFLTSTYIRVPPQKTHRPLSPSTFMWNGEIVRYDENVIVLRDENNFGNAVMWWKAAKRGTKIIANLAEVGLEHPKRVIRALELIAEMAMIGDSVLHYHETALKEFAKSDQIRDAVHTSPCSVYSRILDSIGLLDEWGTIDDAKKERFIREDFSKLGRGDKYGMLFFILLITSSFFDTRKDKQRGSSRTRATYVIAKFEESNEDRARKSTTEKWLSQYWRSPEPPFKNQDEAAENMTGNGTSSDACVINT